MFKFQAYVMHYIDEIDKHIYIAIFPRKKSIICKHLTILNFLYFTMFKHNTKINDNLKKIFYCIDNIAWFTKSSFLFIYFLLFHVTFNLRYCTKKLKFIVVYHAYDGLKIWKNNLFIKVEKKFMEISLKGFDTLLVWSQKWNFRLTMSVSLKYIDCINKTDKHVWKKNFCRNKFKKR